ncbi:hypothetical protein [Flavilitoribacter nigricans]|uniref:HEAT repeat domain-containing protein n=1 Tax=Flavilitoribacter nigricans (strain ATCC 23147 / DSM 23189 / NBRC 102662 / NCIMB 1420 / SS-2) TaxID=1122177 RepID=A0A2D0NJ34_FLAN2|nr:hypothetical protein [Flavilitoribacter nigricans]PHN07763.1 hypothetical protein CRP01_04785 [Flavilitoribacter nigricans DSM 23189 = NBRC 102662]
MKCILFLAFFISINCIYAQSGTKAERIAKLVTAIAAENTLMGEGVGIGGIRPEQYDRFERLKTIASENDLRRLTRHDNAVVRCYAFWALADQQSPGLFPILRDHLQDTARVEQIFGCVISQISVAGFYIELLMPPFLVTEDYYRENQSQLSASEKSQLDSIVLYQEIALPYRNDVLRDHTPKAADYNRIRELVVDRMHVALSALARYRKKDDRELILSFRENMEGNGVFTDQDESLFSAIAAFPDDYFLPFLEDHGRQILEKDYFSSPWATFTKPVRCTTGPEPGRSWSARSGKK